ncbi:hypothetical protein INN88_15385, partial [Staphylococcus aureus]|nr:hypothetical protein [Staphylococcus aureus]
TTVQHSADQMQSASATAVYSQTGLLGQHPSEGAGDRFLGKIASRSL